MIQGPTKKLSLCVAGMRWPPETFLRRLLRGLIDAGVDVTVACARDPEGDLEGLGWLRTPSWDDPWIRRLMDVGIGAWRGRFLHSEDRAEFRRHWNSINAFSDGLRARHQLGPFVGRRWDVLYLPWISSAVELLPIYRNAQSVVLSCRGTQINVAPHCPMRQSMNRSIRTCFERSSVVHCVSEAMAVSACHLGLERHKVVVIRPAVDPEQFKPRDGGRSSGRPLTVSCVGNLSWVKGHEWALTALRKCLDRGLDVRMDLVGDGSERSRVLYTIADLGLSQRVTWHGKLPVEKVAEIVRVSDVFLLSSISEGISNAALEAMACGVPVVTTECGGMREAVRDGVDGFVTRICDSDSIADAIVRLGKDEALRRQIGDSARQRIVQQFHLKEQIAEWMRLLQGLRPRMPARS